MAQKLKHKESENSNPGAPAANLPTNCKAEGCKKKSDRMDFCAEHYDWFKWGLLTREGKKPLDFDKKYQSFMKNKKAA